MTDPYAALRMALKALERSRIELRGITPTQDIDAAIAAAHAALEAQPEPVGWLWQHAETGRTRVVMPDQISDHDASWLKVGPLVLGAAPPQRQPLTACADKPHAVLVDGYGYVDVRAVRAVERHLLGDNDA